MQQQLRTHTGHACTMIKVPGDSVGAAAYVGIDTRIAVNFALKVADQDRTRNSVEAAVHARITSQIGASVYTSIRRAIEAAKYANMGASYEGE